MKLSTEESPGTVRRPPYRSLDRGRREVGQHGGAGARMNVRMENREWTEKLFREAYVFLSEFLATVDTALEEDHPCFVRFEGKVTPSDTG
jgi:hypothetical protein